jgi:signal transduction histidine kinase
MITIARRVVLEDDGESLWMTMSRARGGARFAAMPLRLRRPSARLGRFDPALVDALVGLVLALGIELQVSLSPLVDHRVAAGLGGIVLCAMVAVRRRWPLGAVIVALVAVVAQEVVGGRLTQHSVGALPAVILVFYGAGAFLEERRAWLALSVGVGGLAASVLLVTGTLSDLVFGVIFLELLPWAVGRIVRERGVRERAYRERAERLDAEREQHALAAVWGERARIARELHDVITHTVSVMVIQAGGARIVMDSDPERAVASLLSVERAGREALAEMRRLVAMLGEEEDRRHLEPQPGIENLEELIARSCAAGVAASLRVEGQAVAMSNALELCAYRIVQEALTNALKHAGPARVEVLLRWTPGSLVVEVSDDGRGALSANGNSNAHGIVGMRERAAIHGGTVDAGPRPHGGFTVRARLPLTAEPA